MTSADAETLPAAPGAYLLILRLARLRRITVGRLGPLRFPAGTYAYVGSACGPGGLRARVRHHLRRAARPRWHIDYLRAAAAVAEVWFSEGDRRLESAFAEICLDHPEHFTPLKGFGATDSRAYSHLFMLRQEVGMAWFEKRLRSAFP